MYINHFSFAIPFDPIFKWLGANTMKEGKKFEIYIDTAVKNIPDEILTELEALETQIILVRFLNFVLVN